MTNSHEELRDEFAEFMRDVKPPTGQELPIVSEIYLTMITNFWLSKLAEREARIVEKVEKLIVNTPEEVMRLNKDVPAPLNEFAYNHAKGYTEAVGDVLKILRELKN